MTITEYRDLIVATSLAGGFPAVQSKGSDGDPCCCYRTDDGKRCVAGLLIPDDKYERGMEGSTCHAYIVKNVLDIPKGMSLADVGVLQTAHDDLAFEKVWDHAAFVKKIDRVFACIAKGNAA